MEETTVKELENRIKKLEDILYGLSDDVRTRAVIRNYIFDDKEHATNKPTIINKNGKKYNLQTV